jgi:hypothetical protein
MKLNFFFVRDRGEYAGTTNSFPLPVRSREIRNTHPGSRHDSWGLSCTDGDLLECSASKPCVSLDPSSSPLRCVRGVCVKDDPRVCYMHSDCKSKDMLCTGNGRCSTGKNFHCPSVFIPKFCLTHTQ